MIQYIFRKKITPRRKKGACFMSDRTKKITYLVYGIVQSILLLVCGVALILSCLTIYQSGNSPFSRESVTAQFQKILVPVVLCVAGIVVGIVLSLCIPRPQRKLKGTTDPALAARRLLARVDQAACPQNILTSLRRESLLRTILRILATAVCIAVAIPALLYLSDLSHFDDTGAGLTADILAAMKMVLPAAAVGLSAWIVVTLACHFSHCRSLALTKEALKAAPLQTPAAPTHRPTDPATLWILRGCLFAAAVVFIVLGILNHGMEDVLQKAIRICTECIGLG